MKQGDVLSGRYTVERILASGGMGVVCLGRHVELEQPVAIKFLRSGLAQNPAIVQRFLNEARAAASLRSENVVRVIDVAELQPGRPYLVMEHLDGEDLGDLVEREGALEPSRALGYVLDVCAGLAEAHAAGIVHRDIKPENLILCTVAGREVVKVVDFGLAKRMDAALAKVLTDPGDGMGSPCYMSPEQVASPHAVDARTDIWSLGVVMYRLVTGELPFDGDSLSEVCARVLNMTPRPLSQLRPELAFLDAIVGRCLEKDREARFRSVEDLANTIRLYRSGALNDTQPTTRPPSVAPRLDVQAPPSAPRFLPSDAPMALPVETESPKRVFAAFLVSVVAFVVAGATLGSYAAGGVDRLRELAGVALGQRAVIAEAPAEVPGHPQRQLDVHGWPYGVCSADPVLSRGRVTVRAERELEDDTNEGDDTPKPATRDKAGDKAGDTELDAAEIARRQRRYRRYLDRHGYKPIREVLEQIERSAGAPPASDRPSESGL